MYPVVAPDMVQPGDFEATRQVRRQFDGRAPGDRRDLDRAGALRNAGGVSPGLGYYILDTRDRLAYSELMAVIVLIGALGFLLDGLAQRAYRYWPRTP